MEHYIINDFMESQESKRPKKERPSDKIEKNRRRHVVTIFEQSGGLIGPEEIAEALDIDLKKVIEYLGKTRIQQYERNLKVDESEEQEAIEGQEEKPKKGPKAKQEKQSGKGTGEKLTQRKVSQLVDERNAQIIELADLGYSKEKIARIVKLTPNQLKEIFFSLGLSIYSEEELEEMRIQDELKRERQATTKKDIASSQSQNGTSSLEEKQPEKPVGTERKSGRDTDKRKTGQEGEEKKAVDRQKKRNPKKESEKLEEAKQSVKSFEDLRKLMRQAIEDRRIGNAIKLGEYFIENGDFLTKKEKENLIILVDYIRAKRFSLGRRPQAGEISDDGESR